MKFVFLFLLLLCSSKASYCQTNNQNSAKNDSNLIYEFLPIMPTFSDDKDGLQKYIQNESKYKTSLSRRPDTKNVYVEVIIERDGKVIFIKIARGYNGKLDAEAQRIVEKMPNWLPGKLNNGNTARMRLMFPFWFE